jgi:hypothetical protein
MSRVLRRLPFVLLAAVAAVAVPAAVSAHDPIILTAEQTSPAAGPLLLDGTVSFAVYGTLLMPNDHRGFRARFRAGDTLTLTLLIPDLEPERSLVPEQWPALIVTAPGGQPRIVLPGAVSRFTESFTGTKYVQYLSLTEPAVAGDYGFVVQGPTPARFTVAIGVTEKFGTPVNDITNRSVGVAGVKEWYATPPPTPTTTTTVPAVEVAVTSPTTSTTTTPATTTRVTTPATTTPSALDDVVIETVPSSSGDHSPTTAVLLGAAAIAALGVGVVVSRRRRR